MGNLSFILYNVLIFVRWSGLILIGILAMAVLLEQAATNRLSATKTIGVVGSAILAAIAFWVLPTLVNYARTDSSIIVPDHPIGGYH